MASDPDLALAKIGAPFGVVNVNTDKSNDKTDTFNNDNDGRDTSRSTKNATAHPDVGRERVGSWEMRAKESHGSADNPDEDIDCHSRLSEDMRI